MTILRVGPFSISTPHPVQCQGPTKAVEAFGMPPNRFSARLHGYVEQALGENKRKEQNTSQKWSDAVRTKAAVNQAVNVTPQAQPGDSLSPVAVESPGIYGSIRPLSHALTSKEIELQKKRLVCRGWRSVFLVVSRLRPARANAAML